MCVGPACVARKNDGTAVAWGHGSSGGGASSVDLTNVAAAMYTLFDYRDPWVNIGIGAKDGRRYYCRLDMYRWVLCVADRSTSVLYKSKNRPNLLVGFFCVHDVFKHWFLSTKQGPNALPKASRTVLLCKREQLEPTVRVMRI